MGRESTPESVGGGEGERTWNLTEDLFPLPLYFPLSLPLPWLILSPIQSLADQFYIDQSGNNWEFKQEKRVQETA